MESNPIRMMKTAKIIPSISSALCLLLVIGGCRTMSTDEERFFPAKVPVTVTGIEKGKMTDEELLVATTSFQNKAFIKAPVSGYIEDVLANTGDNIARDKLLLRLRTKEASAIPFDSVNPLSFRGVVPLSSNTGGIIISMDHAKGDYVVEGDQLCSIALPGSLSFIVEVPYELSRYFTSGRTYEVELPDGTKTNAELRSHLSSVSGASQTQRFILKPVRALNLPENLQVKVHLIKRVIDQAISLPKACVLSDEIMKSFWVMKVLNDTLAVRVDITKGLISNDKVEIVTPLFSPNDRFLLTGNYGLGDTAVIQITNRKQ
jgi:hypothetical protein